MLNFGFIFEDKEFANDFTQHMCEALAGVPAFSDQDITIMVPNPEQTDGGQWIAMISIGTWEQTHNVHWVAVNFDRGVVTKEEFDDLLMIEEQVFGVERG